jgi:hypothetical protein
MPEHPHHLPLTKSSNTVNQSSFIGLAIKHEKNHREEREFLREFAGVSADFNCAECGALA